MAWFPSFEGERGCEAPAALERIEAFRAKHDPAAPLIPAHVSLVFPFPTALTPLQLETHVRRVVAKWPPIAVAFRPIRIEANEFLFLMATRGAASISALHDRLYTRSFRPHLRRDLPYAPHITIARQADFTRLEAAAAEAGEAFGDEFTDVIREVALLRVGRDGRIERLGAFPLHAA